MGQETFRAKRLRNILMSTLLVAAALAVLDVGASRAQDAASVAFFRDAISSPIVQSKCIYCHVEGGRSGHTRLVFVRDSAADHEALNLQAFADFLDSTEDDHDDHDHEHGHERILTKIQGVAHGGGECAALPVLPGGPPDPTLLGLLGLVTAYLILGWRPRHLEKRPVF